MQIRIGDEVIVTAGANKGRRGKVLKVDREGHRVVVEGVNRVYKHVKKSQKNPQGGRLSKESAIPMANVAMLCPKTQKPTRVGVRYLADGSKERYAKKSGASLGTLSPANPKYAKQ
ncbi:MAG: 50S ribosomal protein L24 [Pirellulaceae bacterium]|nr:50S ribosomal protein L24 [Pirellulaceae bacterium]